MHVVWMAEVTLGSFCVYSRHSSREDAQAWLVTIVNWMIVITTLYSGIEYFVQNWKCLGLSK